MAEHVAPQGDDPFSTRANTKPLSPCSYFPPFEQILAILHVSRQDLKAETLSVATNGIMRLLAELLRHIEVNETWYFERYPDVHGAVLSGDAPSAAAHFRLSGYCEGRLPHTLPFDSTYYFDQYADLAAAFDRSDAEGLRIHFLTQGYFEGRAGVPEHFDDAERWRTGLRAPELM